MINKKLYVGNLPYTFDDASLENLFCELGAIEEAKVITDRMSGRSKGFGFVTFSEDESAEKAIEKLNGATLSGRTINVSFANAETSRDKKSFRSRKPRTQGQGHTHHQGHQQSHHGYQKERERNSSSKNFSSDSNDDSH